MILTIRRSFYLLRIAIVGDYGRRPYPTGGTLELKSLVCMRCRRLPMQSIQNRDLMGKVSDLKGLQGGWPALPAEYSPDFVPSFQPFVALSAATWCFALDCDVSGLQAGNESEPQRLKARCRRACTAWLKPCPSRLRLQGNPLELESLVAPRIADLWWMCARGRERRHDRVVICKDWIGKDEASFPRGLVPIAVLFWV